MEEVSQEKGKDIIKIEKPNEKTLLTKITKTDEWEKVKDIKDIYNPDIIKKAKSPGVKEYERSDFKKLIEIGYTDAMRHIEPDNNYWTWWDPRSKARDKDNGWRLDYFLISDKKFINNCQIHKELFGSDHCPISLDINI